MCNQKCTSTTPLQIQSFDRKVDTSGVTRYMYVCVQVYNNDTGLISIPMVIRNTGIDLHVV